MIHSLMVDGVVVSDHAAMAEAAFEHFSLLLGTTGQRDSLDLDILGSRFEDLVDFDAPFTKEEIWEVIRRLPHGKAPGPDRFTTRFLQSCWEILKDDILVAFAKLHFLCGPKFQGLNQALLIICPSERAPPL